ncbi:MAG: hypothetical protein J6A21_11760 [Lentisphaeria bacterium]|nr:hypothetical protein [Lentisphaeria bacterium]
MGKAFEKTASSFPEKLLSAGKKLLPEGVLSFFSFREDPSLVADTSHMLPREEGSKVHLLYAFLYLLGVVAALWQHGDATFTFAVLISLLPVTALRYLPYRFADILTRHLLSCAVFFGACFWIVFRISRGIPMDLVLVEALVLGGTVFLINAGRRDYHYLFFISVFLLEYSGLIPRKLLLGIAPAALLCLFLLLSGERLQFLAGERTVSFCHDCSPMRSLRRSWHIRLFQILLALPIFLCVFSVLPLHDTGSEGLFEVSFVTARTSALPQDLRNWLKQNRKFTQGPDGEMKTEGKESFESQGESGKKDLSSSLPGNADGNGQGSSSPGKELVFTAALPVKLYHLGTLYDVYDGEKWRTSEKLRETMPRDGGGTKRHIYSFGVTGKYTIVRWVSPNLYAPFRPVDFQFGPGFGTDVLFWTKNRKTLTQTAFNAKFLSTDALPRLPFRYQVNSVIQIPLLPPDETEEEDKDSEDSRERRISSNAGDFFSRQAEKEKEKEEKALAAAREKQEKALAARKSAAEKKTPVFRPGRPAVLRYDPAASQKPAVVRKADGTGKAVVKGKDPEKLFRAKVLARDPLPPGKLSFYGRHSRHGDPAWRERIPKEHFLQLPENLSTRVTGLAGIITKEARTPYEKAVALRDFLRSKYKYRLDAPKVPPGVESTEFFLFESREGHCEYFAAALTVLARASGLPARVAVGFSPGNYNTLTKQFEVHEYHAHAWSQIFIERVGWLTFDAVPPGNISSETLPAGLGLLRDPFGEEWKITPPELTATTLGYVRNTLQKEAVRRKSEAVQTAISKMLQDDDALKTEDPRKKRTGRKKVSVKTRSPGRSSGPVDRLKNFFLFLTGKAGEKILAFLSTARGKTFLPVLLIFLAALFLLFRKILFCGKLLCCRYRFGKLLLLAEQEPDPGKKLLLLYRALRLLLILAGMERKHNQELLEYGKETAKAFLAAWEKKKVPDKDEEKLLQEKSGIFAECVRKIFSGFYALEYGNDSFSPQEAQEFRECVKKVFSLLRELYPDGLFFLEKLLFAPPFEQEEAMPR